MADETPAPEPAPADPSPASTTEEPAPPAEALAEEAIQQVQEAAESLEAEVDGPPGERRPDLPSFDGEDPETATTGMSLLDDVHLKVKIELGRTRMLVEDVLRLGRNSVVELDKAAGDPVDIYVNDRHIARGEVLVVDENFCVRVNEIIEPVPPEG